MDNSFLAFALVTSLLLAGGVTLLLVGYINTLPAALARGWRVAQRIESGICHINGPTVHDEAQMPFGGVKASGWGRFGGRAGIEAFTDLRWITMQTTARYYPF